jgi:hypothetical protein
MNGSRSLNFEDEIFFKGVRCNISPVSIGILPVIVSEELNSWKSKLMENIFMTCQHNTEKISVSFKTRLRQGHFGNCASMGYLFGFGPKISHYPYPFLSLLLLENIFLFLLSISHATLPLLPLHQTFQIFLLPWQASKLCSSMIILS